MRNPAWTDRVLWRRRRPRCKSVSHQQQTTNNPSKQDEETTQGKEGSGDDDEDDGDEVEGDDFDEDDLFQQGKVFKREVAFQTVCLLEIVLKKLDEKLL